jgi:putative transposase
VLFALNNDRTESKVSNLRSAFSVVIARSKPKNIRHNNSGKNDRIRKTLINTKERRKTQICKQFEIKLDESDLSKTSIDHLSRLFVKAKWYYNSIIATRGGIFDLPDDYYKILDVQVKVGDNFETKALECLSTQMKQAIFDRAKDSIRGLCKLKQNGHIVGALKFKGAINSIPLKQYHRTWQIIDKNHVHIQGIKQKLRIRCLTQIPKEAETSSALLMRKHGDYYPHIATYQSRKEKSYAAKSEEVHLVGMDFGIRNQITLSNSIAIRCEVPIIKRLKRLQGELGRRKYASHNWYKTREKLSKEYDETVTRKKDVKNKLLNKLTQTFSIICYQDDPIKGWMHAYGAKVMNTGLGGITSPLKQKGAYSDNDAKILSVDPEML